MDISSRAHCEAFRPCAIASSYKAVARGDVVFAPFSMFVLCCLVARSLCLRDLSNPAPAFLALCFRLRILTSFVRVNYIRVFYGF